MLWDMENSNLLLKLWIASHQELDSVNCLNMLNTATFPAVISWRSSADRTFAFILSSWGILKQQINLTYRCSPSWGGGQLSANILSRAFPVMTTVQIPSPSGEKKERKTERQTDSKKGRTKERNKERKNERKNSHGKISVVDLFM